MAILGIVLDRDLDLAQPRGGDPFGCARVRMPDCTTLWKQVGRSAANEKAKKKLSLSHNAGVTQ